MGVNYRRPEDPALVQGMVLYVARSAASHFVNVPPLSTQTSRGLFPRVRRKGDPKSHAMNVIYGPLRTLVPSRHAFDFNSLMDLGGHVASPQSKMPRVPMTVLPPFPSPERE